ncbi:MAG: hypothetical protein KAI47_10940 [Deltaproteobacteria bacterium]|nr:hypothetical protein [Deltaproteobacteria bacterium]
MALDAKEQRDLLARIRDVERPEGERHAALGELLEDFRRPALAAIHRVLRDVGAGFEHADEAWSRAIFNFYTRGIQAFEGRANAPGRRLAAPRSYFVRLAINAAIDVHRQLARSHHNDENSATTQREAAPGQTPATATPEEALEARESIHALSREIDALRACIAALADPYGEALTLYYLEEVGPSRACAERVGITPNAFMQRLTRARRQLAACVAARLREDEGERRKKES